MILRILDYELHSSGLIKGYRLAPGGGFQNHHQRFDAFYPCKKLTTKE